MISAPCEWVFPINSFNYVYCEQPSQEFKDGLVLCAKHAALVDE
jgi:hypothetical protein